MNIQISQWFTSIVAATALTAIAGCGGGDSPPEAAKTAQVRVAALGFGAALDRYASFGGGDFNVNLVPSRQAPALAGLTLGGVALPPITTFGATAYVTVPVGDYVLPIPAGASGPGLTVQPISIQQGVRITLTRASLYDPWVAISEPQDAPAAATDAEISVLSVAYFFGAPVAPVVSIEISNAAGTLLKRVEGGTLLTSLRVPAGDIRIAGFAASTTGEVKRVFRSEVISLAAGSSWMGSVFLESAGGNSVQLISKDGALKVAVDDRARLRLVNMSEAALAATITSAGRTGPTLLPAPFSLVDYFGTAGDGTEVRYSVQQSGNPMQLLKLPQLLPGRGYDVIILNAPAPDQVRAMVVPHVQFVKDGGAFCRDPPRVLNAIDPPRSVSIGIVFSSVGTPPVMPPAQATTPNVIDPLKIALGAQGCSSSINPIALLAVTDPVTAIEQRVLAYTGPSMGSVNALSTDFGMTLPGLVPGVNAVLDGSGVALRWREIKP